MSPNGFSDLTPITQLNRNAVHLLMLFQINCTLMQIFLTNANKATPIEAY